MSKKNEPAPGDGLRSMKTTTLFRAVNYELYAKPNKVIMIFGALMMLGSSGYIIYMRQTQDTTQYYTAVTSDGREVTKKKTSKWVD